MQFCSSILLQIFQQDLEELRSELKVLSDATQVKKELRRKRKEEMVELKQQVG